MKQSYVAIPIKKENFMNGQNPTTQPGVRMPYYPREELAMKQAAKFSSSATQPFVCFVATVNKESFYGQLDTLNPNEVQKLTMAVCKPGESPNQTNTVHFFRNGMSWQQISDIARDIVAYVEQGATMKEASMMAYNAQEHHSSVRIPEEYKAGYGMGTAGSGAAGIAGSGAAGTSGPYAAGTSGASGASVLVSDHHEPGETHIVFSSDYAAQQLKFLPDPVYTQAVEAFNYQMITYSAVPGFKDMKAGYEAAAVTYAMQAIAENITMKHPEYARQAYDTMCAAQKIANAHGIGWDAMEYKPEANHQQYIADHCQGMSQSFIMFIQNQYNKLFRESIAYTLPEQQLLAMHATADWFREHRIGVQAAGVMNERDAELLEKLYQNLSQELEYRGIRPGALLDDGHDTQDVGDDTVGEDAI